MIPSTQAHTDEFQSGSFSHTWHICRPGPGLTQLLQAVQVDDVLCRSIVSGTDEEVGFLQDEVRLLPLLRVQHGPVLQQPDTLELPGQQTVAAEGGCSLTTKTGTQTSQRQYKIKLSQQTREK